MKTCCICLEELKNNIFTLSCSHDIHLECFLSCIYTNDMNLFLKCPLCRKINSNTLRNTEYHNIKYLIPKMRCCANTKSGNRCKKSSSVLRHGMCNIHYKEYISDDIRKLICNYIFWLFETNSSFRTKYLLIDVAKNLCISDKNIKTVQDITHKFYYFHAYNKNENIDTNNISKEQFYDFFSLTLPPEIFLKNLELSRKRRKLII